MKNSVLLALMVAAPAAVCAQDADTVDALKKELRELRQRTEQLEEKLKRLEETPAPKVETGSTNAPGWSATAPLPMVRSADGKSYLNLALNGVFAVGGSTASDIEALQPGGHDPSQRGFTLQGLEVTFDGVVDQYFRAHANLIFHLDRNGETHPEIEEGWAETLSLPWELTLRAGQMFTDFGRHNSVHPHAWDFVDAPLVNARLLGPEGLRNPGVRLLWHAPIMFHPGLSFTVQNSSGETANSFRSDHEDEVYLGRLHDVRALGGPGDLLFASRAHMTFDLAEEQSLQLGASAAVGPNASGRRTDTQIYGADLFWKWTPHHNHGGFPFVSWQSEAMLRHYQAGAFSEDLDGDGVVDADLNGNGTLDVLPAELLKDWGAYTQVAYGFTERWVAALRFDYVDRLRKGAYESVYGNDSDRGRRWRLSPNLTWQPTHYSKVRLQYNLDERAGIGTDHSVWLQIQFSLGSHDSHHAEDDHHGHDHDAH